jgi:hypothetical protein
MSGNEAPSDEEISFKVESAAPKSPSKPAALCVTTARRSKTAR